MKCDLIDCDNESQTGYGGTTCTDHVAHARGIGSPVGVCRFPGCGRDQRDHKTGFPEHVDDLVEAHKIRRNS